MVMGEPDIYYLKMPHTSVLGIYKVFEPLVGCLKGIWLQPYSVTLAKLDPDLVGRVHLRSGYDAI